MGIFITSCDNATAPQDESSPIVNLEKKGGALVVPTDFPTIQDAVDAVQNKGEIHVYDGTYNETVIIDGKDINLIAMGDVIISPLAMVGHEDAIQVYDGKVTIDGFTIDATNCKGGIYAGGGYPINESSVSVKAVNNDVNNYLKNGITVNGSKAYGDINNNNIWGSGPLGIPHYAQNGIQFGYGGTGKARENIVGGNLYTGPDWGATGILIFESSDVIAQNNIVKECGTGIAVQTWGWYLPNANNNKVNRNTVLDCQWGISIAALGLYSNMDAFANNNKVVNNTINAEIGIGVTGIEVYTWDYGVIYNPHEYNQTAYNNKIIHNTIEGYPTAVDEFGSLKSKIHANVYQ